MRDGRVNEEWRFARRKAPTQTPKSYPRRKSIRNRGKTGQRDAMRHSGSVRAVTLSPEAESGLLQHFPDHCVAIIVEFSISD